MCYRIGYHLSSLHMLLTSPLWYHSNKTLTLAQAIDIFELRSEATHVMHEKHQSQYRERNSTLTLLLDQSQVGHCLS